MQYASGSIVFCTFRYYNDGWKNTAYSYALHPIVTLKSGLTPANALGTKDNPFVLP